jgi:hypothetical protein
LNEKESGQHEGHEEHEVLRNKFGNLRVLRELRGAKKMSLASIT